MKASDSQTHFLTKTVRFFYINWVFSTGCKAPGYTVLLAPVKALPCLCFLPPMAEKSKPPALRVVGDSFYKW
jgi:hypothetical protein